MSNPKLSVVDRILYKKVKIARAELPILTGKWYKVMAMELKIDTLGRIFLPKKLRERYGLKPNSVVQVSESDEGILLTQADERPSLKRMPNGLLIFTGGEKVDFDIVELIDEIREERHRRILGLDK